MSFSIGFKKGTMPTVSVVITTYNRAGYVKKAIESVLSQTYQDWELLVVDDGSKDDTGNIVRSYCIREGRIHYIYQGNAGVSIARNTGLSRVTGKYVAFLDDDDRWLPHKLQAQINFMESHPEIGMCYGRIRIIRSTAGGAHGVSVVPTHLPTRFDEILGDAFIPATTVMIRYSCLRGMSWFDTRYSIGEDFDFWLRFSQKSKVAALDEVLAEMTKDGRKQLTKDDIQCHLSGIEIYKNVELTPQYQRYERLRKRSISRLHFELGRSYVEIRNFVQAAKHFAIAIFIYPFVALMFRQPNESSLAVFLRIAKSYAYVPWFFLKGFIHGGR